MFLTLFYAYPKDMKNLYQRYDIKAPRYTSYPPMPFWNGKIDQATWLNALKSSLRESLWLMVIFTSLIANSFAGIVAAIESFQKILRRALNMLTF